MKPNSISEDFPFKAKYENIMKNAPKRELKHHKVPTNVYTNETPSMFRLDFMVENTKGYKNPFMDEVIKVERNEEFKKMDFNCKQINLIDKIKSKRQFSQDPKVLRYIRSESDIIMENKRERNKIEQQKTHELKKYILDESEPSLYNDTFKKLLFLSPRIGFKVKNNIDENNLIALDNGIKVPKDEKEKFRCFSCVLEPKKSGYLRNLNDFNISEAENRDHNEYLHFQSKKKLNYNSLTDKIEEIQPPPVIGQKWESFIEK